MRMRAFAIRNVREILRDPLTLGFGIGFPVILLLLLTIIQNNVPVQIFALDHLTPGVAVFGYSFISLFSALLISKDRSTALMTRLLSSPLTAKDFLLGYALPLLPMALAQSIVCFLVAYLLGLRFSPSVFLCLAVMMPAMLVYIALGLICGSVFNDKQVGGICGAVLTNVTAWLSGTWFDLKLMGSAFTTVAHVLPFANAVDAGRAALAGNVAALWQPLLIVCAWALVLSLLAVRVFAGKMRQA